MEAINHTYAAGDGVDDDEEEKEKRGGVKKRKLPLCKFSISVAA